MTTTSTGDGEFSAVVGSYSITDDIVIAHDVTYDDHVSITGTLTVNAGKTFGEGAASKNLTVSGAVQVNGTLDLDRSSSDGNASFGSLTIDNGGTVEAPSHGNLTLTTDATSQFLYETISGATFNNNDGTVIITGDGRVKPRAGTGNFHNLTLNASGNTIEQGADTTVEGNLTITAGEWSTGYSGFGYSNLTVTGTTTIGPASGAADQATLTCNSSTVSLGALRQQADYAVNIEVGGTFVGGTGTHTFGSLFMAQSANAKATMTTGQVKVNGYNNSANKAWRVEYGGDTFDNANGTVMFQFNGFDSRMSMRGESHANNAFHNLIIHMNGDTRQISPDNGNKIIVDNDLTITRGKLVMGQNHALEVGGDCVIDDASDTAELEMGASSNISSQAVTFGSLTIGNTGTYNATSGTTTIKGNASSSSNLAWANSGTFTHNSGTVLFDGTNTFGGSSFGHINPATNTFNNLTINADSKVLQLRGNSTTLTVAGDLTMTDGTLMNYGTDTVTTTVTGDVSIANGATIGANTGGNDMTAPLNFGSLTIESGGTFIATSDTTTITNKNSSNYMFDNNGTFTHNNGTVHWKADTSSGTWYAMDGASSATETEFYNISTERVRASGTEQYRFWVGGSGRHLTVLNNIDIGANTSIFSSNGSGNFKLLGNCYIRGTTGGLNLDNVTTVNMGTVSIESGGTLEFADGNSINVEGIRNMGGTVTAT